MKVVFLKNSKNLNTVSGTGFVDAGEIIKMIADRDFGLAGAPLCHDVKERDQDVHRSGKMQREIKDYNRARTEDPSVKISCAAIPSQYMESEVFGNKKGGFSIMAISALLIAFII